MTLSTTTPVLRIFDESKAREFYVSFLGFAVDWEHRFQDDFPLYLQVFRDACTLHLSEHHGEGAPGTVLRIQTDDVDALRQELIDKNYRYAKPGVGETPWRTREMSAGDPFGNCLSFVQRIGSS